MRTVSKLQSPTSLRITPDIESHKELEKEVAEHLESREFLVCEQPYHTSLPKPITERLQNLYEPTALYIRARADRLAVHKKFPLVFEWEAKTHQSRSKHDICLEVLPLIHHLNKANILNVRCLYVYRDDRIDPMRECGFWVHQLPSISVIMIPPRWSAPQKMWYRKIIKLSLPEIKVVELRRLTGGSNDPFAVIPEEHADTLPHWMDLIDETLKK